MTTKDPLYFYLINDANMNYQNPTGKPVMKDPDVYKQFVRVYDDFSRVARQHKVSFNRLAVSHVRYKDEDEGFHFAFTSDLSQEQAERIFKPFIARNSPVSIEAKAEFNAVERMINSAYRTLGLIADLRGNAVKQSIA